MRRIIGCLALAVVASCESGNAVQSTPPPSPSQIVAAEWQGFPADHSPRPIVFFYSPFVNLARPAGFPPFQCGKFTVKGALPQGTSGPAYATWNGHDEGFTAITAADALAAMARLAPEAGAASCDSVQPAWVFGARLAYGFIDTDRGRAWATTWLFSISGSRSEVGFPALPMSAYWTGGSTVKSLDYASIDASGRHLTVGLCGGSHTVSVAESSTVVELSLRDPLNNQVDCASVLSTEGFSNSTTVTLDRPLGGRVVVDSNGLAMEVCSTVKGCG